MVWRLVVKGAEAGQGLVEELVRRVWGRLQGTHALCVCGSSLSVVPEMPPPPAPCRRRWRSAAPTATASCSRTEHNPSIGT